MTRCCSRRKQSYFAIARDLAKPCPQPESVAASLRDKRLVVWAMSMPHDCSRIVYKLSAGPQNAEKHIEVLATTGRCARTERFVEPTKANNDVAVDREAGAGAQVANSEGKQRNVSGRLRPIEYTCLGRVRPVNSPVEVSLCRRSDLASSHHSRDTRD
jgi:hypothetical protein